MSELRDEELVLYYYGEARRPEDVRRRLDASAADRERYDRLCRTLETVDGLAVPEPPEDYGEQVWRRLAPRLERTEKTSRPWWQRLGEIAWPSAPWVAPRWAAAGAVAVLLVLAFLLGRYWPTGPQKPGPQSLVVAETPAPPPAITEAGRQRIVRAAVGRHLEQSQRLLLELSNTGDHDIVREEQARAAELLTDNRIYRRASERAGQAAVADLLEELERFLLEVENRAELSPGDVDELTPDVEDLLFKIRIVGDHLRRRSPDNPEDTELPRPALSDSSV